MFNLFQWVALNDTTRLPVATVTTTPKTLSKTEVFVICNMATAMTVNLPAAQATGKIYYIKNINVGIVVIKPNGTETIDGSTTLVMSSRYDCATIADYGTGTWGIW